VLVESKRENKICFTALCVAVIPHIYQPRAYSELTINILMLKVKLNCISEKELFNRYVNNLLNVFFHVFLIKAHQITKQDCLPRSNSHHVYHGATALMFTMEQQPSCLPWSNRPHVYHGATAPMFAMEQ